MSKVEVGHTWANDTVFYKIRIIIQFHSLKKDCN